MAAPPPKTPRTCSQCGNNGHNSRTCNELSSPSCATPNITNNNNINSNNNNNNNTNNNNNNGTNSRTPSFMLFGVRLTAMDCNSSSSPTSSQISPTSSSFFRKSMSMNNLSQYDEQTQLLPSDSNAHDATPTGYASDDAVHASGSRCRERKRGVPWTEDEHRLFLMGLSKVGKGDWRGISRNFVKTRTPTQVASHAQKYFLRRSNINRRRRRSSLFDITTDTVSHSSNENQLPSQESSANHHSTTFPTPFPPTLRPISTKHGRSIPILPVPPSTKMASLNLNQSPTTSSPSLSSTSTFNAKEREYEPFLALKLSQAPSDEESSRRSPKFGGFNGNGDSIISVA